MENWKRVWRTAISPLLSLNALQALAKGLSSDDPKLIQASTTTPCPLPSLLEWDVEAACALAYCGWQGEGLSTVGEVEEFFARMTFEIDNVLGKPGGSRDFINWFDCTPRLEAFKLLAEEVQQSISSREHIIQADESELSLVTYGDNILTPEYAAHLLGYDGVEAAEKALK